MKNTHAAAGLICLMCTAGSVALAQDVPDNPRLQKLEDRMADWKTRLMLTPQQMEQVRPIVREELRDVAPIVIRYDPNDHRLRTKVQMGRELKEIREKADKQLKLVLTGAQWITLQQIRQENKDELKEYLRDRR